MMALYPKHDPHWVEAEKVERYTPDGMYVNVWVHGTKYKAKHVDWSNPFMDKTKSDCLVQDKDGNWLRIWWNDKDLV
jgi:hypothetical protein